MSSAASSSTGKSSARDSSATRTSRMRLACSYCRSTRRPIHGSTAAALSARPAAKLVPRFVSGTLIIGLFAPRRERSAPRRCQRKRGRRRRLSSLLPSCLRARALLMLGVSRRDEGAEACAKRGRVEAQRPLAEADGLPAHLLGAEHGRRQRFRRLRLEEETRDALLHRL